MYDADHQKLVDIMFQVAESCAVYQKNETTEDRMEYVATQLRACGFDTEPVGSSWGVLKEPKT